MSASPLKILPLGLERKPLAMLAMSLPVALMTVIWSLVFFVW